MKNRQKRLFLPHFFLKNSPKKRCTGGGSRVGVFYLKSTAKVEIGRARGRADFAATKMYILMKISAKKPDFKTCKWRKT